MIKLTTILFLMFCLFASAENKTSVGLGITIENVEISGSKVIPVPRTDYKTPIVLRIKKSEKIESGYRYSIYVEGLDPGNYDLAKYLQREDNTPIKTDAIPLEVYSLLPKPLTQPHKLIAVKPEKIGGYTTLLTTLGILWILVLLIIVFYRKTKAKTEIECTSPPTITEKIQAILKQKEIGSERQAQLERLLIGHWIGQFPELKDKQMSETLTFLRNHEKSGPMIQNMERWLHSGKEISNEEIDRTLAPYLEEKEVSV